MNLDFENTEDVSDAAIEWVLWHGKFYDTPGAVRDMAQDGYAEDRAIIIAARLIQEHHPELLVDPDAEIVRKAIEDGFAFSDRHFDAVLRIYKMGKEAGRAEG